MESSAIDVPTDIISSSVTNLSDAGGINTENTSVAQTARHVPIWSSSGIAAGMDMAFAFIKHLYGKEIADDLAISLEYERHENASWDPFAEVWGVGGI